MGRRGYPTDLTEAEWEVVRPFVERAGGRGRPAEVDRREILDAMSYAVRTGCAWRLLPSDFPPWQTVYSAFWRWSRAGALDRALDALRAMWRERQGRHAEASAGIVDSQSAKTTEKGANEGLMRERE